jgi:capsular exopolysaccharide synthesis family protein
MVRAALFRCVISRPEQDHHRMSRIDEALRAWESAKRPSASAEDDARSQKAARFQIHQYPRETGEARKAEGHNGTPFPRVERLSAPPPPAKWHPTAEFEAKLVTAGRTGPVPLEQYRRLAAALHDAQIARQVKAAVVTSAVPSEGKTLTVVNLALTLSESYGRRVLLIDADFRAPSVHDVLGIRNERGLSEALSDAHSAPPMIEISPTLSVLTSGTAIASPLAGLSSPRMDALIELCTSQFDWVLLDTPPVGVMPDAQLLARRIGSVVFVIGAGSTPAAVVERAIVELGPEYLIGTVLNRIDDRSIPEIGYYSHYPSSSAT